MDHTALIEDLERQLAASRAELADLRNRVGVHDGTETALQDSDARYRNLFQTMGQGYALVEIVRDGNGCAIDLRLLETNNAYLRLLGVSSERARGRLVYELFPEMDRWWLASYDRIVRTGKIERIEHLSLGVWFEAWVYPRSGDQFEAFFEDITERKHAEQALIQNEERQSFVLKLSDALRAEPSADAIADRGLRMLSEHLHLDRCYIGIYRPADDRADLLHQVGNDRVPPLPASIRLSDFPNALRVAAEGTLVIEDFKETVRLSDADRRNIGGLGLRALVAATLRKGELNPLWATVAVSSKARRWTRGEITVIEEAAERIWAAMERARAEAALRESEGRFSQFAASSSDALWVRSAATLMMEYVSPAIATVYGVPPEALLGDVTHWAALIVPEDRDSAVRHLEQAKRGEAVVHEFRVLRPSDGGFRWIRNTSFPLLDENGRLQRIGGIAQDVTETKLATEHTAVLLAELQHRVRNIMAVIRAITASTAERAETVSDYAETLNGRLVTLARVQALLTRAANAGASLNEIVGDELSVLAQHEGQYVLDGPDLVLSPKAAEVMTLAVHELTTNALKYGALAASHGSVTVRWATFEKRGSPWLGFDWIEEGAPERTQPDPPVPQRRGFGSELIEERVPYELGGQGAVVIERGGARCHLEFPLADGDSILETDAPQRSTVFGGVLDMAGEFDLSGQRVLVIEDDFYLAKDAARALRGAGAEVLGPCPNEDAARDALEERRPDAAVVDINLGRGPSFKLAAILKDSGIPFVFTTGYDPEVIPAEFGNVERLQKPVQLRKVVGAIAKLVNKADLP